LASKLEAFCQYRKPARFSDILQVELTVEELKEKSVKLGFSITKKETAELLATGCLVVMVAARNTGKATQIQKEIVDKVRRFSKQIL